MSDPILLLHAAYAAFNARGLGAALAAMHPDVVWPNGMEGGTVHGRDGVRAYWTRQWGLVDSRVVPRSFARLADGRVSVEVDLTVRDLDGTLLRTATVRHVYAFEDGLVRSMEVKAKA